MTSAFASSSAFLATGRDFHPRRPTCASRRPRAKPWIFAASNRSASTPASASNRPASSSSSPDPRPSSPLDQHSWRDALVPGAVVEAWSSGDLSFGVIVDTYERGVVVSLVDTSSTPPSARPPAKVSYGELVAVWPRHLCPSLGNGDKSSSPASPPSSPSPPSPRALVSDVQAGLRLIQTSRPRSLNLLKLYDAMRRVPKADPRSRRTSFQLAPRVFPLFMKGPRERRAAATVATAVLIASDSVRFKRGEEGTGWRALPPSVAVARTRSSFVETCRRLLDVSTPARDRASPWTREHLEILRELEISAASGSAVCGTAATALEALGYETSDDGAASLLLAIGYWATGSIENDGGGTTQATAPPTVAALPAPLKMPSFPDASPRKRGNLLKNIAQGQIDGMANGQAGAAGSSAGSDGGTSQSVSSSEKETSGESPNAAVQRKPVAPGTAAAAPADATASVKASSGAAKKGPRESSIQDSDDPSLSPAARQTLRDWTFPPAILAEARESRLQARERRRRYVAGESSVVPPRRSLIHCEDGRAPLRVYCIDDKNARFLDDALSIEILQPGRLVRVCVHVADVDETVRSGSSIDELAKERGQSLYLPLKPLHMLPAAAMDAASFSTSSPTEGITAAMDVDVTSGELVNWEIFASLVPPVNRVNYDQLDSALEGKVGEAGLGSETLQDLQGIAAVAPVLADKLDTRRNARKLRRGGAARLDADSSEASNSASEDDEVGIAAVRLVRKREYGPNAGRGKVAKVVDFRSTGGHAVVADMLISVSTLFRQFAHRHGAFLPEDRGAYQYVSRCGTAPMRRYGDLAIQRQVKCILFGREPAGRRRMDELRSWLAKRHAAGEKTLATRRKAALYDSLADHCLQQKQAAKQPYATLRGKVRSVSVTRRRAVRAEIGIEGTGLFTTADVDDSVVPTKGALWGPDASLREQQLQQVRESLTTGDRVSVRVSHVDTVAQRIVATVVSKLNK